MIARLWDDESGATAIEYALIAGFLSLAVVAGAATVGTSVSTVFEYLVGVFEGII